MPVKSGVTQFNEAPGDSEKWSYRASFCTSDELWVSTNFHPIREVGAVSSWEMRKAILGADNPGLKIPCSATPPPTYHNNSTSLTSILMDQRVCRRMGSSFALTFMSVTASVLVDLLNRCPLESDYIDQSAEPDTKSCASVKKPLIQRQTGGRCVNETEGLRVDHGGPCASSTSCLPPKSLDIFGYRRLVAQACDHVTHCGGYHGYL